MDINTWRTSMAHTWLAAAISIRDDQSIINIGAGEGHACFALARRLPRLRIHGIEWNRDHVRQAAEYVRTQQWQGRVEILHSEGVSLPPRLAAGTFDQAMMHWTSKTPPDLSDQMRMLIMMIKPQGVLTLLMKSTWLPYMLQTWGDRVGNIQIFPLWFEEKTTSDYIIIQAQKSEQGPLVIHKGFIVDQTGGSNDAMYQNAMRPTT